MGYADHVHWLTRLSLQTKVLLLQAGIVLLVVALLSGTFIAILSGIVQRQYEARVMDVAQSVALMPTIRDALTEPDPPASIQPLAEQVRTSTGLAFIVVTNQHGVRYSHPNSELIGRPVDEDDSLARAGQAYTTTESGTLGLSIRAKVPIFDDSGQVLGVVSAGILAADMQQLLSSHILEISGVALGGLLLGLVVSFLLARHIKRQMFGLEPAEIAALLEQREAMLHGIREGVIAIDGGGRITLANDEARRLLGLPEEAIGWPIADFLPESRLPAVVESGSAELDQVMLVNGRSLVASRVPVRVHGKVIGAIATFRDQTEVQELARELSGARSYLDALRAQAHEFANKLHTISGLIELGWQKEAVTFIKRTTQHQQTLIDDLPKQIENPAVAALLVGKASLAAERGISFSVSPESRLPPLPDISDDLVTIVGNLVDNAFEALDGRQDGSVALTMALTGQQLTIEVRDSGPGIPRRALAKVFEQGFTSKANGDRPRGVGLALVKRSVLRLGGDIAVRNDGGAVFTARLPVGEPTHAEQALLPLTR